MPKLLPSSPSLHHLRKQAKDLQTACHAGDSEAIGRVKASHPAYAQTPTEEIPANSISLRDAQFILAREYHFKNWARLKEYVVWDLAVQNKDIQKMEILLKEKPSRAKQSIMRFRRNGSYWTNPPLDFAGLDNNIPMAQLLLKYGASLKAAGLFNSGNTFEFIDYAIEQGGDINIKHYNGSVLLRSMLSKVHPDFVRGLIRRGADVNTTHPEIGITPLHSAVTKVNIHSPDGIVQILIDAGADVNAKAWIDVHADWGSGYVVQGETPLHFAAIFGIKEIIELLLERGADKQIQTAKGETPLDFAIREKHSQSILELLK